MTTNKSVTYGEGIIEAVTFFVKVRRGNIITCARKITKFRSR